ncbi:transcriptional regulator, TetR family [Streptosporangium canum]|uniref:Transcriptional regulator, TetR family n=1 Tax=Streptosporangium canum TaxID=324952 RepID=A0A1I3IMY5_9ACTN|nr:TetR/AcrR family transcriptional regulator [Streptosporangium canum]SFI49344.1 transcriptional regulator, TetR family [Streptosporangium canum]
MSTTEKIAEVARDILIHEGAEAVSMRRVAGIVGITPMAIYRHYPNRQALLQAVADATLRELAENWGARAEAGDWQARLIGLMHDFLDFALGSPHLYRFVMTDQHEQARHFPDDFKSGGSPAFERIVSIIEDGMAAGILRTDVPLEAALALTSATQGLVQLYLGGRIGLDEIAFRELCERNVRRILNGLSV